MSLKQLLSEVREAVDARKRVFPVPTELIPDTITASARRIDCGQGCSRTFLIVGYPGEVPLGWTQALIDCAARVDVACHLGPVDTAVAVARIRRRRARLESSRRHAANRDQLDDPAVEAAAADAADLAGRLATGDTRMYAIGVYVTVHAEDPEALEIACGRLVAQSAAAMLDARPASWRQLPGVTSTLPLGVDALGATRTLDSDSAAAAFPLIDPDTPPTDTGVLYGLNLHTGAAVVWDRWACDNHNAVVVGSSGSGKSYFAKSEALRQLYEGVEVSVIDPDGEYADLAGYVDGTVITPGAAGVGLNPLELPADPAPDALTRRIMFASTMAETLIG
ncbi:MAG TPA: DUF87 domain-containing protein, partial [Stackebrandtia sp.]|uniref:helicase HerA domain-containing protein n=1 Tax=Stackebrandtia sp. TaxID=2023065 RepID=UPI002D2AB684